MLMQPPRLTNSLREHLDVDRAYLKRKEILQNIKSKGPRDDLALARRLVHQWDDAPSDVWKAYKQFLAFLRNLIDGEFTSDEFQEVAIFIYGLFSVPDIDITRKIFEKRGELQKLVGYSTQDSNLHKVAELAHSLYILQRDNHEAASPGITDGYGDVPEFGCDIAFTVPVRFFEEQLANNGTSVSESLMSVIPHGRPGLMHTHHTLNAERDATSLRWLKDSCDDIVKQGGSPLSGDELAMALCRVLLSNKAGDEIAGDLLDLVGDGAFDLVKDLLLHRKELLNAIQHGQLILKSEKMSSNSQARMPSYGTQVTVQTESERQMDKLRRKEEKRNKRVMDQGAIQDIAADSFSALLMASEKKQPFDELIGTGQGPDSFSVGTLPQGTTRFHGSNYEEVRIPPTATAPLRPDEKLIEIGELDDFAQAAFRGYKSLNRIQSRIFHTTYNSNENILVCAPTGAGKTNIAMISVLHEIKQHFWDGILHKEFKIVYVAPMKALAAEVTSTFSHRLSPLNLVVKELTGDMQLSRNELEQTQVNFSTFLFY